MDGHALLLSKFCLDCKPWHLCETAANPLTKYELHNLPPVAWQDSSLRDWLNGEFAANAFSRKELHGIRAQDGTGSRITLPTEEEMKHYFTQDNLRAAKPTPYAVTQGALVYSFSDSAPQYREHVGNTLYWLRDLSKKPEKSALSGDAGIVSVYWDGSFSVNCYYFNKLAVRPSFWLDLESAFGKRHARTLIDAWKKEKNTFNRHFDVVQDSQQ